VGAVLGIRDSTNRLGIRRPAVKTRPACLPDSCRPDSWPSPVSWFLIPVSCFRRSTRIVRETRPTWALSSGFGIRRTAAASIRRPAVKTRPACRP